MVASCHRKRTRVTAENESAEDAAEVTADLPGWEGPGARGEAAGSMPPPYPHADAVAVWTAPARSGLNSKAEPPASKNVDRMPMGPGEEPTIDYAPEVDTRARLARFRKEPPLPRKSVRTRGGGRSTVRITLTKEEYDERQQRDGRSDRVAQESPDQDFGTFRRKDSETLPSAVRRFTRTNDWVGAEIVGEDDRARIQVVDRTSGSSSARRDRSPSPSDVKRAGELLEWLHNPAFRRDFARTGFDPRDAEALLHSIYDAYEIECAVNPEADSSDEDSVYIDHHQFAEDVEDDVFAQQADHCMYEADDRSTWERDLGITDVFSHEPPSAVEHRLEREADLLAEKWSTELRCEHCDATGVLRRSLCDACRKYKKRNGGALPALEILQSRRWRREAPVITD